MLIKQKLNFLTLQNNRKAEYLYYLIMFQFQKEDLDHQLAINGFREEVLNKVMVIEQLGYDLQKLFINPVPNKTSTIQFVRISRRVIKEVQNAIERVKNYLVQIKIQFFYQLIYKSFHLLVVCFHNISIKFSATLKNLKQYEQSRHTKADEKKDTNQLSYSSIQKLKLKEIEHCDFLIRNLEEQQLKIDKEKRIMEKQLKQQSMSIQNITASDTVNQLQNLNKEIQKIISNSYKIANDNILYRYQQVSKKILQVKKPEQIEAMFCSSLSANVKDKFIKTMEKITREIYKQIREKQKEQITLQILGLRPTLLEVSTQTEWDGKFKQQIDILNKEKKILINEVQSLKKSNAQLHNQIEKLVQKLKQSKQYSHTMERKNQQLQQQMKRKVSEFQNEMSRMVSRKGEEEINNELLSSQFNKTSSIQEDLKAEQQEIDESNQLRSSKYRNSSKQKINSVFFQRELQRQKKQKVQLITCLQMVLRKFSDMGVSQPYEFAQINRDMRSGTLKKKLEKFTTVLPSQVFSLEKHQSGRKQSKRRLLTENPKVQTQSQNQENHKQRREKQVDYKDQFCQTQFFVHQKQKLGEVVNFGRVEEVKAMPKLDRLEALKKQFIEKISKNKKEKSSKLHREKNKIINITTEYSEVANKTMDERLQFTDQQRENAAEELKASKAKLQFCKKDISFQSFKLIKINKNNDYVQKKGLSKIKKLDNFTNPKFARPELKKGPQHNTSKPIISIQMYEILKQVRSIISMIEIKNDHKGYFFTNFFKCLVEQFRRLVGKPLIQELLKSELSQYLNKSRRHSIKLQNTSSGKVAKHLNIQISTLR